MAPHVQRQHKVLWTEAGHGEIVLGFLVLYAHNKDYWRCLQRMQQRSGLHQDPCKELSCFLTVPRADCGMRPMVHCPWAAEIGPS